MKQTFLLDSLDNISDVARDILSFTLPYRKFAFYGAMGVGKTTLIKALSLHLGASDLVNSPTFSIINEYQIDKTVEKIYHFDFYRIENEQEAFDLGYEEYLFSNAYCFIEWPEKIINLIHQDIVKVKIFIEDNIRKVEVII